MGDPRLRQVATDVTEFDTPELHQLINDMMETMAAADGAGLAAPQIGVLQRVVIFGVETNPRYPDVDEVPMTVLINPEISPLSDDRELGWEGCLSVPGMRGVVPRYQHVRYRGHDQYGKEIDREVSGFHSRVVQHECDHLDGVLYPMRMQDLSTFGYIEELVESGMLGTEMPAE
jgi:peptide deformylase